MHFSKSFNTALATLVTMSLLALASAAQACSVPVFRYALEQWRPDQFDVVVFHEGSLTDAQKTLVAKIEPTDYDAPYTANARVKLVDLSAEPPAELVELWERQETQTLPWMLVKSPAKFGEPLTLLAKEFSEENVAELLNSPLRKTITDRLLKSDSVVWVLLKCGDEAQDAAAEEILAGELKRLSGELKLPEIDPKDIADGFLSVDPDELKLKFSMVDVSRDDPHEQAFVQMLLTAEPDLRDPEFRNQPMALPIFGRGRILYAVIGKGINAENIEDASRFLTGACQCTVKAQNPGVDMLTTVDWDSLIVPTLEKDTVLPPLAGLSGFGKPTAPSGSIADAAAGDVPDHENATASEADVEIAESSAASTVAETPSLPVDVPAVQVSRLAIYVVGGLALVVVGLSIAFGTKPS